MTSWTRIVDLKFYPGPGAFQSFWVPKAPCSKEPVLAKQKFNMFKPLKVSDEEFHGYFGIFPNFCDIYCKQVYILNILITLVNKVGLHWGGRHDIIVWIWLWPWLQKSSKGMQRFPTKIDPSKTLRDSKVTVFHPAWGGAVKEMCQSLVKFQDGHINKQP